MGDDVIDLKQLQVFISIVDSGSFSGAAAALNRTQSAISQQMANLEKALNIKLIDRSKKNIHLTVAGYELYQEGVNLLKKSRALQDKINTLHKGKLLGLKIGIVDSMGRTIGLEVLKRLQSKAERINLMTEIAPNLLEALIRGEINLALTMLHTEIPSNIKVYPLIREEYFVITPKSWPVMSLEECCRSFDYIAYSSSTPTGSQTLNWLRWRGFSPHVQFEIAQADNILQLIAQEKGWTLGTSLFLALEPSLLSKFRLYKLPGSSLYRELVLLSREGEFDLFCENLAQEVITILKQTLYQRGPVIFADQMQVNEERSSS